MELSCSCKFIHRNAVTASRLKSDLQVSFKLYLQAEEAKWDARELSSSSPYLSIAIVVLIVNCFNGRFTRKYTLFFFFVKNVSHDNL